MSQPGQTGSALPGATKRRAIPFIARTLFAVAALSLTAACPARMAVNAAGNVAGAAIKTTGNVVGTAVQVVTFRQEGPQ